MGATGIGKSELAVELAEELTGEIVSMDSRQVYRRLNIGTAKPTEEELRRVPHHLIDILEPDDLHSAGRHCELVRESTIDILSRGALPILVGGTAFYFRSLFEGLIETSVSDEERRAVRLRLESRDTSDLYDELHRIDPERGAQLSPNDRVRIVRALEIFLTTGKTASAHAASHVHAESWDGPRFVLTAPREVLRERIADRTRAMFQRGWIDEVERLLAAGVSEGSPAMNSLGYAAIAEAIRAGRDAQATLDTVITQTQQYAKRQETFFRSIEGARWVDVCRPGAKDVVTNAVREWLAL